MNVATALTVPSSVPLCTYAAAALVLLAGTGLPTSFAGGQEADLKVQGPWATTRKIDPETREFQFIAMTPAVGDQDTWLLLACTPARQDVQVYLVATSAFATPLAEPARLELRFDTSPVLPSITDTVEGKLARFRTPQPRTLALEIGRGSLLSVSIKQPDGLGHEYRFGLQPTEPALADIRVHCLAGEP